MNIYIAGPMRGYPRYNVEAFDQAVERWKAAGHRPTSPANIDRAMVGGSDLFDSETPDNPAFLRRAIVIDAVVITHSDAIALLPGWERSSGTTVELALAQMLGLPIYDAVTMERIYPSPKPWSAFDRSCMPRG